MEVSRRDPAVVRRLRPVRWGIEKLVHAGVSQVWVSVGSSATTLVRGAAGSAPWAWPWPSLSRMIRTMSAANSTAPRKSTMHPTHQKRATRPFWGVSAARPVLAVHPAALSRPGLPWAGLHGAGDAGAGPWPGLGEGAP